MVSENAIKSIANIGQCLYLFEKILNGHQIQVIWQHFFCRIFVCPEKAIVGIQYLFLKSLYQIDMKKVGNY